MEAAGLQLVPGLSQPLTGVKDAVEMAKKVGYPLMLKASAGGGGIGMQAIENEGELIKAFAGNQARAKCFLETETCSLKNEFKVLVT